MTYGYSLMVNGRQERRTDARWTKEDVQAALDARRLAVSQRPTTPAVPGPTVGHAIERYLQAKSRKKSIADDTRHPRCSRAS